MSRLMPFVASLVVSVLAPAAPAVQTLPAPDLIADIETAPTSPGVGAFFASVIGRVGDVWLTLVNGAEVWMTDAPTGVTGVGYRVQEGGVSGFSAGSEGNGFLRIEDYYTGEAIHGVSEGGIAGSPFYNEELGFLGYLESSPPQAFDETGWFFSGSSGTTSGLWRAAGSSGPATFVETVPYLVNDLQLRSAQVGARLFLWDGRRLATTDDSTGATPLTELDPSLTDARDLTAFDGQLWFAGRQGGVDDQLWSSDGTVQGTVMRLEPTGFLSEVELVEATPQRLWLRVREEGFASELWLLESGTTAPFRVVDLNPGFESGFSSGEAAALPDGRVVFAGSDGVLGRELYISDGTAAGTTLLRDIAPGPVSSDPRWLASVGDRVVFAAPTPGPELELWATDGTPAGTQQIAGLAPGDATGVESIVECGGDVVLIARPGILAELWTTDGTAGGTRLLSDLTPTLSTRSSFPEDLLRLGSQVLFSAERQDIGRELWATDGTTAGTRLVRDLVPGVGSSKAEPVVALGERALVRAMEASFSFPDRLWATDGTTAGTVLLVGPQTVPDLERVGLPVRIGPWAVFPVGRFAGPPLLMRTDGTPAGTVQIQTLSSSFSLPKWSAPRGFASLGDSVVFADGGIAGGLEPWVTDGTPEGTKVLSDLAVGPSGSDPGDFTRVGDDVFFEARLPSTGRELFRTDGTAGSTGLIVDLTPGPADTQFFFNAVAAGDSLVFGRGLFPEDDQVWVSDGTPEGTQLLLDDRAFFFEPLGDGALILRDPEPGQVRLVRTDGTVQGTEPLPMGLFEGLPAGKALELGGGEGFVVLFGDGNYASGLLWYRESAGEFELLAKGFLGLEGYMGEPAVVLGSQLIVGGTVPGAGYELVSVDLSTLPTFGLFPFGASCSTSASLALDGSGSLRPGDTFAFELSGGPLGEVALVYTSALPALIDLTPGCTLHLAAPVLRGAATTDGAGSASLPVILPADPSLVGLELSAQALVGDPGGPLLGILALTNALELVVGS